MLTQPNTAVTPAAERYIRRCREKKPKLENEKPKISTHTRIKGNALTTTHHMIEVRTREEVANILGMSAERVRQIEGLAMRKLRHALKDEWEALTGRKPQIQA